jgi:hypothetical protein
MSIERRSWNAPNVGSSWILQLKFNFNFWIKMHEADQYLNYYGIVLKIYLKLGVSTHLFLQSVTKNELQLSHLLF